MMNYLLTPISHKLCRAQLLLVFGRPEAEEALVQICDVLRAEGYAKESGPAGETLFGRGSKAGRLVGGGLSGRQEFQLTSEQDGDLALLSLKGTASVITAGAIGVSKMRKELARLSAIILSRLGPSASPGSVAPEALGRFGPIMTGRQPGRGNEYIMVIILVLIAAAAGGLAAAWALIKR